MNFRKVNNGTGWAVFLIALLTYVFTREARGSLWDTGEFIASANQLGLPHPPGAPLFVLLGRFFIILFGDNGMTAASAVNFMSALASAGTILFLFWSITHFARKMFVGAGEELTGHQLVTTMGAGVVGALAYTFSDSFWYSAVEGEVYALSSFFTALVFWAILKWEHADEKAGNNLEARTRSDRWIVFIFFMMGLSIGVHILNLLTIPAIVMVYYYRRYQTTTWGAIWAFLVGCVITGVVQAGVIQYSMRAAGQFDVFFVNTFSLPFFSGFAIYFIAIATLIIWALSFTEKNISKAKLITWFTLFLLLSALPFILDIGVGLKFLKFLLLGAVATLAGYFLKPGALKILKLSLWCYAFMMLGYFMYFTSLIRSNANPGIDMNNVDNPINLVYYLSREQYGEAPLVYGPHFAASYRDDDGDGKVDMKKGEMRYRKGADKYIPVGRNEKPLYEKGDMQLFPRVWDPSNDQYHADFYAEWLGLAQDQQTGRYEAPTYGDNINWFFSYQMGLMYWRYFMWNFSGKQNDIQGFGNKRDGNWITGISLLDNQRLGDQDQLPDSIKNNKARNKLYLIPFLLGIVGCVYQFLRNRKDWIVTFLLFFLTGIAVVLYLNQPGNQPRERDYAYVGSFYAFAIWIGLAVVAFVKLAQQRTNKELLQNQLLYGGILTFLVSWMSCANDGSKGLIVSLLIGLLYALFAAGVTFLVRAVSSAGQNLKILNLATLIIGLSAPLLMAQQEWDDHDRSHKTTAPDLARDYLESCAPNAILFSFGDNDTYPLWYAQEVEGVRRDIRVVNFSLLGIDWYINQLRYKINDADSIDVIFSPEQVATGTRDYIIHKANPRLSQTDYYNLYDVMKNYVGSDDRSRMDNSRGEWLNTFPVTKVFLPVDKDLVRSNRTVNESDSVLDRVQFDLPKRALMKNDILLLNIIAANQWKRPIYFTSPMGELGFAPYLRKDGLSYRFVPIANKYPQQNWVIDQTLRQVVRSGTQIRDNNSDTMYNNLMNKYRFGGADREGVYFDEENRRHILNIRALYAEAAGNLADAGKLTEAQQLIDKVEQGLHPENIPYAMVSRYNGHNQTGLIYLEACYKAGKKELAEKIRTSIRKDLEQQKKYYDYISAERPDLFGGFERSEAPFNEAFLMVLDAIEKKYAPEVQVQMPVEGIDPTIITNPALPDSIHIPEGN